MGKQQHLRLVTGGATGERGAAGRDEPRYTYDGLPRMVSAVARSWWGKPRAEWAYALAEEVAARARTQRSRRRPAGWMAGVLLAAAIAEGMHTRPQQWALVLADIETVTGVERRTVFARWRELTRWQLTRPSRPPVYWEQEWDHPPPELADMTPSGAGEPG